MELAVAPRRLESVAGSDVRHGGVDCWRPQGSTPSPRFRSRFARARSASAPPWAPDPVRTLRWSIADVAKPLTAGLTAGVFLSLAGGTRACNPSFRRESHRAGHADCRQHAAARGRHQRGDDWGVAPQVPSIRSSRCARTDEGRHMNTDVRSNLTVGLHRVFSLTFWRLAPPTVPSAFEDRLSWSTTLPIEQAATKFAHSCLNERTVNARICGDPYIGYSWGREMAALRA